MMLGRGLFQIKEREPLVTGGLCGSVRASRPRRSRASRPRPLEHATQRYVRLTAFHAMLRKTSAFQDWPVLIEMRLENYAVIDNLVVEFGPGLNLLTGETGAGKSILVDALALLLGDKASSDVIRTGAERAVVAAVFEAEGAAEKPLAKILEANGLDESDDGSLILRREIAPGARGECSSTISRRRSPCLRLLAPHLAIIHAQNESILNFDWPGAAGACWMPSRAASLNAVETAFAAWKEIRDAHRGTGAWRAGPVAAGGSCGFFRSARLKKGGCRAAKTSDLKARSACSPMPRKSITRR